MRYLYVKTATIAGFLLGNYGWSQFFRAPGNPTPIHLKLSTLLHQNF